MNFGIGRIVPAVVAIDLHREHLDDEVAAMPLSPGTTARLIAANREFNSGGQPAQRVDEQHDHDDEEGATGEGTDYPINAFENALDASKAGHSPISTSIARIKRMPVSPVLST